MSKVIITDFSKRIKGKTVLDHITYEFEEGTIYGIYGRNGSGKTMLLRAIAGLIHPTSGTIHVDGKELHKEIDFPEEVGVIIENTNLLPQYDAYTNLYLLSKIKKIATKEDIIDAIERVGLDPYDKLKVRAFSLGMKQRLSIAQAIFEHPKLLLLDEPTNALDEESIILVREILLEYKKTGATILIASHNKEDLEILSDKKLNMVDGKMMM